MRSINLLPRIPLAQKLFVPLVAGSIVLFGLAGTAIAYYHYVIQAEIEDQKREIAELDKQIVRLAAERQPDAATQTFKMLTEESRKLAEERRDWREVAEQLTFPMPASSRLTDLAVKEDKLTVKLEFADMKPAAAYVLALQKRNFFESVSIKTAENVLAPLAPSTPSADSASATSVQSAGIALLSLDITLKPAKISK
ncbi:PilN domain-containing protein [Paenibacillus contaminans]|uniref:Fimbrial assembly protein n=1 Tax=Paenibacillus contaminans TaxID=450362 RepID=A0A329MPB5_9BACL|nr:hypothetical protein [Paenibacillus contaminans]RAV20573.1 hypothetical protein DQG23_13740 [Paenibacillus contaminans]